jgi:hypothetical protein
MQLALAHTLGFVKAYVEACRPPPVLFKYE